MVIGYPVVLVADTGKYISEDLYENKGEKIMTIDEKKKFEQEFENEEMEITVLVDDTCCGASIRGAWMTPSVRFAASINNTSDEPSRKKGRIEWIISNKSDNEGWGYEFAKYGIYRLLVCKCVQKELAEYQSEIMNNRYMLIKILEEDVKNEKLEEIKEYLQKPVTIESQFGTFQLDRELSWFACEMDWCGNEVSVTLESDEDCEETANKAMSIFQQIAKDKAGFDKKSREYASEQLLELANDWLADDDSEDKPDEITKEMFMESMELDDLCVNSDGSITLYYDDGDMFWGHAIEVDIEEDGTYSDANIAG